MPINISKSENITTISEEYPDVGYLQIPYKLLEFKGLTMQQKAVLCMIKSFNDNSQKFIASNGYIARRLGYSLDRVRLTLQTLEMKGYIKRYMYGGKRSHIELGSTCVKLLQPPVTKRHTSPVTKSHTYKQEYNQDINKRTPTLSNIDKRTLAERSFNAKRQVALNKAQTLKYYCKTNEPRILLQERLIKSI